MNGAGKRRLGGRGKKISTEGTKEIERLIKKSPGLVRAPQLKKTLKLRCTVRTVQRTVASLGYKVYRRGPKKVLGACRCAGTRGASGRRLIKFVWFRTLLF